MKRIAVGLLLCAAAFCQQQNVVVFREAGHFAGWPANHGIWSWGNEIVVGFEVGHFRGKTGHEHAIDYTQPEQHYLARSLDGQALGTVTASHFALWWALAPRRPTLQARARLADNPSVPSEPATSQVLH